jgi:hypothetical protein
VTTDLMTPRLELLAAELERRAAEEEVTAAHRRTVGSSLAAAHYAGMADAFTLAALWLRRALAECALQRGEET